MSDHEQHERYLNFVRELDLDSKYLHFVSKQHSYPYVLRARPNHRLGIFINLDDDSARLQSDDAYNSYWYSSGYGYEHIHYDPEGHSYKTDLHTWVTQHVHHAHIFNQNDVNIANIINRNPKCYYDLMLLSTHFRTPPSYAAQRMAQLLRKTPEAMLSVLTEEPRDLKRRVVLRTTEENASVIAKLICQSGGRANITPSLNEA